MSQLPDTNEEEVDAMIADIDDDGNGEVDFNGRPLTSFDFRLHQQLFNIYINGRPLISFEFRQYHQLSIYTSMVGH